MRLKKSLAAFLLAGLFSVFTLFGGFEVSKVQAGSNTGGYSNATGSTDGAYHVYSLADLTAAFNSYQHHIVVHGNINGWTSTTKITTFTFAGSGWSNFTVEGAAGGQACLQNIQLKFDNELNSDYINNIVVKNLNFYGDVNMIKNLTGSDVNLALNYLGVSFRRCNNVWLDHCRLWDTSDDLTCFTLGSDNITVSYCHFYFSNAWMTMSPDPWWDWGSGSHPLSTERLSLVVGAFRSDSYSYGGNYSYPNYFGINKLHITFHHNKFGPNLMGRPLIRGYAHLYNNLFDNTNTPTGIEAQDCAIAIGSGSVVYSESNHFYKTNDSNEVKLDVSGDTYQFYERNNWYDAGAVHGAVGTYYSYNFSYYGITPSIENVTLVANDVNANCGPK